MIAEADRVNAKNAARRASVGRFSHRRSSQSVSATISACSAYTSVMIAWLQNVYEPAKSSAAATPATSDPASSAATTTMTPEAAAASTAEARFSPWARSPAARTKRLPIPKYSGYPSRGVIALSPPIT